jgi:hypothetical protein
VGLFAIAEAGISFVSRSPLVQPGLVMRITTPACDVALVKKILVCVSRQLPFFFPV